ncbi:hypothetical protein HNP84_004564 [Thermocatellispora tengchongensis]|uniref:Uncharacterized protein n=1 Tax=Thermocatellispora tengchongensis TaxID=1073253 RepID=A0A840PBM6_9ACTN|nr:hypothetical protein [Thermocatellispora tengchongensis]
MDGSSSFRDCGAPGKAPGHGVTPTPSPDPAVRTGHMGRHPSGRPGLRPHIRLLRVSRLLATTALLLWRGVSDPSGRQDLLLSRTVIDRQKVVLRGPFRLRLASASRAGSPGSAQPRTRTGAMLERYPEQARMSAGATAGGSRCVISEPPETGTHARVVREISLMRIDLISTEQHSSTNGATNMSPSGNRTLVPSSLTVGSRRRYGRIFGPPACRAPTVTPPLAPITATATTPPPASITIAAITPTTVAP